MTQEPHVRRADGAGIFDLTSAVDAARLPRRSLWTVVLASLVVVLDGFDNQLLALSVPQISGELELSRGSFSWVFAVGYLGLALGAALGGWFGDRIGRKPCIILAVLIFGSTTCLLATAQNIATLGMLRAVSGIGVGMVFPLVTALVAESSPLKHRNLAVALSMVCVPVGGLAGGLVAAEVLPTLGWRVLFVVGGAIPLLFIVVLSLMLRESVFFLAVRGSEPDLARVRVRISELGYTVSEGTTLLVKQNKTVKRASFAELLRPGARGDSLALWGLFFLSMLGVYAFFSWGPAMFADAGFDAAFASRSISIYNLGGIAMAVAAATAMSRFGSRKILMALAFSACLTAGWMYFDSPNPSSSSTVVIIQLLLLGACFAGLQTTLYALAAYVYPAAVRSTGVGMCGSVGRFGAVAASFAGAALLALGDGALYGMLAIAGFVTGVLLLAVKRHSPPVSRVTDVSTP